MYENAKKFVIYLIRFPCVQLLIIGRAYSKYTLIVKEIMDRQKEKKWHCLLKKYMINSIIDW